MELALWQYAVICALVFLGGIVDAVAGGGGLITLPAYLLVGLPPHLALGTNKLGSAFGTSAATFRYARNGYIRWKRCIPLVPLALIGSLAGSRLALIIPGALIEKMLIVVLPVVAFLVLRDKKFGGAEEEDGASDKRISQKAACVTALLCGLWDGLYGPGTGTFLILLLTQAAKYTLKEAEGATKVINLSSNVAALVTFLLSGNVLVTLGIAAAAASIAGNYLGAGMIVSHGTRAVRPLIIIVLVILFVKIITGS